jgi:signal peptidase I
VTATKPTRRVGLLAWRIVVVLLLVVLVVKWGVVDGYEVRGNSMQPVLEDRVDGADHVFVFKRHFDLFPPRRLDLAVFENPENSAQDDLAGNLLVKRIWALAGDMILIENGDVLIQQDGKFRHAPRSLETMRSMLVPVQTLASEAAAFTFPARVGHDDEAWTLDARGGEAAFVRPKDNVDDGGFDRNGTRERGANWVRDVAMRARFKCSDASARLQLELRELGDTFVATIETDGAIALVRHRGPARAQIATARIAALGTSDHELLFMNVDDRVALVVDGAVVLDVEYGANTDVAGIPSNVPAFGVTAGAVALDAFEVLRDVYVTDEGAFAVRGQPFLVPEGSVFALGDHSSKSRDSRHFGALPLADLIGKPFFIFMPFQRLRAL